MAARWTPSRVSDGRRGLGFPSNSVRARGGAPSNTRLARNACRCAAHGTECAWPQVRTVDIIRTCSTEAREPTAAAGASTKPLNAVAAPVAGEEIPEASVGAGRAVALAGYTLATGTDLASGAAALSARLAATAAATPLAVATSLATPCFPFLLVAFLAESDALGGGLFPTKMQQEGAERASDERRGHGSP
jgi:hypothetical protein